MKKVIVFALALLVGINLTQTVKSYSKTQILKEVLTYPVKKINNAYNHSKIAVQASLNALKETFFIAKNTTKIGIIIILAIASLYGIDMALEFATSIGLPSSFFNFYNFGTLSHYLTPFLLLAHTKTNNFIDKIVPIIKPIQFTVSIAAIYKFLKEKGESVSPIINWFNNNNLEIVTP